MKDGIKTGGEWVSSLDLENILSQLEAVAEAAAIGVPDEKWGERPLMLVVIRPEWRGTVDEKVLRDHMLDAADEGLLPKYSVPDRFVLVDALPKTSVGKLDKKAMRQEYR
jgi:fatty-acyl-CoA synthase